MLSLGNAAATVDLTYCAVLYVVDTRALTAYKVNLYYIRLKLSL
jgi:hypothetical protein